MFSGEKLLKRGLHRSVWLSACGGAVIKRFRSSSAWRRATDGRRARREARMLARLFELDLPVPRLIALSRSANGWELHSAVISDARSLDDLLEHAARAADPARLGAALARFHARGFLHGDLHPGNLLATPQQDWFMIDVSRGRIRTPLSRSAALDELTGLLAALRERTPLEWRAALWRAWSVAVPEAAPQPDPREWEQLELAARIARQRSVTTHLDRWLRPSSRLRALEIGADAWLVDRRRADAEELLRALDRADLELPSRVACERATLISGTHARRQWLSAARALEHGLPCLQPIAWHRGRSLAVFEPTQPDSERELRANDAESHALADALADRGLWSAAPPRVERTADGRLVLSPAYVLPTKFDAGPDDARFEAWFADSRPAENAE